jgi:hypothetical protein
VIVPLPVLDVDVAVDDGVAELMPVNLYIAIKALAVALLASITTVAVVPVGTARIKTETRCVFVTCVMDVSTSVAALPPIVHVIVRPDVPAALNAATTTT